MDWLRNSYYEDKAEALEAENAWLRQLVKDTVDDMKCLETCDSYGHDDLCPVAHPENAWRQLREENARLSEARDAIELELAMMSSTVDQLKQREAELVEETTILRRLLWLNHGHQGLYGDDGEMQCGQCFVDYKRTAAAEIEKRIGDAAPRQTQGEL